MARKSSYDFEASGYRLQGGAAVPTRPRTLAEVQKGIEEDRRYKRDPAKAAALMLRHGWISDDARAWLSQEYPQGK